MTERIDYAGAVLEPLDEEEARDVAARLRRRDVDSVAVCFVNSYANPAHEQRMREILEEELPGVIVSTSSEVLPEIFEHERFSTTVANAVLAPLVGQYTRRLEERLTEGGYDGDLLLLHSGGGVMTPKSARAAGRPTGRLRDRGRRDRQPTPRRPLRLRRTRSGWTWAAPRPTSRSSTVARRG